MPDHRIPEVGARVRDLQEPERKMSTTGGTEQGTVYVLDEPDTIRRKFKRAVTDSGSEVVRGADKPGISNLIEILAIARGSRPRPSRPTSPGLRYGDFKVAVADEVADWLRPVRERAAELRGDEGGARGSVLAAGAEKARAIADGHARRRPRGDGRRGRPAIRRAGALASTSCRTPITASSSISTSSRGRSTCCSR